VSGGIAPRILNVVIRGKWVVNFTPWPPYFQGKSNRCPLDRRLRRSQGRSGSRGEEKIPVPAWNRVPVFQPVA